MDVRSKQVKLLIGSRNLHKGAEIEPFLRDLPFELFSLQDFPEVPTIKETGRTYAENAILKASFYSRKTGMWALADDSGLEVEALGRAPGIFSARFAGANATDPERIELLLAKLAETEDLERKAKFCCVVAIADAEGMVQNVAEGICKGTIASKPRGQHGFGYDPVFIPRGGDRTFAELPQAIKDRISHRAKAMTLARDFLCASRALT